MKLAMEDEGNERRSPCPRLQVDGRQFQKRQIEGVESDTEVIACQNDPTQKNIID